MLIRTWLLLPAAAEGLINRNECQEFVGLGLGKIEFGGEVVGFVSENLEVAGYSTGIANVGEARGILGGRGEKLLLLAKFSIFAIGNQRVGSVAERLLNGLLVAEDGFLLLGFGESDARANSSGGEDGLSERASKAPEAGAAGEAVRAI